MAEARGAVYLPTCFSTPKLFAFECLAPRAPFPAVSGVAWVQPCETPTAARPWGWPGSCQRGKVAEPRALPLPSGSVVVWGLILGMEHSLLLCRSLARRCPEYTPELKLVLDLSWCFVAL